MSSQKVKSGGVGGASRPHPFPPLSTGFWRENFVVFLVLFFSLFFVIFRVIPITIIFCLTTLKHHSSTINSTSPLINFNTHPPLTPSTNYPCCYGILHKTLLWFAGKDDKRSHSKIRSMPLKSNPLSTHKKNVTQICFFVRAIRF